MDILAFFLLLIFLTRCSTGKLKWIELPFFIVLFFSLLYVPLTLLLTDWYDDFVKFYVYRVVALTAGFGVYLLVVTLFNGVISLERMKRSYIMIFLPVTVYGLLVQIPAVLGVVWCISVNEKVRSVLTYFSIDIGRLSWFASEPSFAAFQIVSVIGTLLLFDKQQLWHKIYISILILSLLFTKSVYGLILLVPLIILGLLAFTRTIHGKLIVIFATVMLLVGMSFSFHLLPHIVPIRRIENIAKDPSATQRYLLLKSTFIAGIKTFGLGLGPGQYQHRWREFIDREGAMLSYTTPSLKGKLDRSIQGDYKPYSVIGGIWGELGIIGLFAVILPFFIVIKNITTRKLPRSDRYKLFFILCTVGLSFLGSYPISMPQMWFLLALLVLESGKYCSKKKSLISQRV